MTFVYSSVPFEAADFFNEISYERYVVGDHPNLGLLNFLHQ